MQLTLPTPPPPTVRERSIVPGCLQQRAPLNYEIRDENDALVRPTLAGYMLGRGRTYRLKVNTQDRNVSQWKLRLVAPRSILKVDGTDEVDGDGRSIQFHTAGGPLTEWKWFFSIVCQAPVHLDFLDGREPYKFHVPVILRSSRLRGISLMALSSGGYFLLDSFFRDRLTMPSMKTALLYGSLGLATAVACFVWDQWRFYHRAKREMSAIEECAVPSARSEGG